MEEEEEEKEETEEGNNRLFTALSGDYFTEESLEYNKNNIESYTMSSHQIDYSHPVVKEFLSHMDTCFQSAIMGDADAKIYDTIWFQLGNKDLATVYLTVMLAKLLSTEQKALEKRQKGKETETYGNEGENNTSISDADFNEDNVSIQEVVEKLGLGIHKYNEQHPLLLKRRESIKKRKASSLILQTDETLLKEEIDRTISLNSENLNDSDAGATDYEENERCYSYYTGLFSDMGIYTDKQFRERMSIVNSLLYVSLFYRFDHQDPSLLDIIERWRSVRYQQLQQVGTRFDSISEELKDSLCPPIESLYKYLQLCIDYDVVKDTDVKLRPQLSTNDPLTLIGSYAYTKLQTICRIPRFTENILSDLIILIKSTSGNQASLTDSYNTTALKNTFNLIKLLLSQLYIERDSPKLNELAGVLKVFFLEPMPIGRVAKELLDMCQQLQRDPGCLMRKRFERSIRQCRDRCDPSIRIDKHRKLYIFYNPLAKKSHHLLDRFDTNNSEMDDLDIILTKANLVLNVYGQSGNGELMLASHELYTKVSPEILAEYYSKVSSNSLNLAELEKLKEEMLQYPPPDSPPTYRRFESPKMPDVEFEFIALPEERNLAECDREAKIFPRSAIYNKLKELIEKAREETGITSESNEILPIDIGIAGGSGTLQYFVHSLYLINKPKSLAEKKSNIDFRVYLLPLGENNYLSNWLEKYDGWYSRHIHYPLLSMLPLVPHLRTSNANRVAIARSNYKLSREAVPRRSNTIIGSNAKKYTPLDAATVSQYKPPKRFLTPHRYMEKLLNDYVIDGYISYPVHIYNAQLLCNEVVTISDPNGTNKTSQQKSRKVKEYISLSFCQRVDIGMVADAYQFAKDEGLEETPLEELLNNRNFKYQAIPLVLSYVPMDPTNDVSRSSEVNEQPKVYQNISILSCSSFGDRGTLVSPGQPWLEVFAENTTSKKRSKLRDCDIGTNYHVGSITIESNTHQPFTVMLDGELYGPFHKVIINAPTQTFNLQTFNNVDVY